MSVIVPGQSPLFRNAASKTLRLTIESMSPSNEALTANIINLFRNTLPSISNYFDEVLIGFKAVDTTDLQARKVLGNNSVISKISSDFNMVKDGHNLVQVPEGFSDHYVPYLTWLEKDALNFIDGADAYLKAYYTSLSLFISTKEAKTTAKNDERMFIEMTKTIENVKDGLNSFFDSRHTVALRTVDSLFDRGADIKSAAELARDLNRRRAALKTEPIINQTKSISDLLNLIIESSENDKIPEVSGAAASSLAQGALVAAQYVELVGALRYRIEEAINAVSIAIEQIEQFRKKQ